MLAIFDLPTVPKVPKPLRHKGDFRTTSFLWMPKRPPLRKCLWHGPSGDLDSLGGGQVGKIFLGRSEDFPVAARFHHACKLGFEDTVSKRLGSHYQSG